MQAELSAARLFLAGMPEREPLTCIQGYELVRLLGRGGMAEVHLAWDREERPVAVKLARAELLDRPEALAAFREEIATTASLEQPGIVRIHTSGVHTDGRPFLVMDVFDGALSAPENRQRFSEPEQAVELVRSIARAVQFAHDRGVLHCDLKPQNVLLDAAGRPHVSDFGLARRVDRSCSFGRMLHGGTPGYMSPEQAAYSADLTPASDVFSLGVILYELLTGELPFGSGSEYAARVATEDPAPLRERRPELDPDLEYICGKALQKDRERRYRSAAELADDLDRTRDGLALDHDGHRRRAWKWVRRHRLRAATAAFCALLLAYVTVAGLGVAQASEAALEATLASYNASAAEMLKRAVATEIEAELEQVRQLVAELEPLRIERHTRPTEPPAALVERRRSFDGLFVMRPDGSQAARWPATTEAVARGSADFRDYFKCAARLGERRERSVCISLPYRSTVDQKYKFAYAAPLFDENGAWVGVLAAKRRTSSTFGRVTFTCPTGVDCKIALLAPLDRPEPGAPRPDGLAMVAGPRISRGTSAPFDVEFSHDICRNLGCERSLVGSLAEASGPQIFGTRRDGYVTAVGAVGKSGFFVLVASRFDAAGELWRRLTPRSLTAQFALLGGLLSMAALVLLMSRSVRRTRPAR